MDINEISEAIGFHNKKDVSDLIYEKISRLITSGKLEEGYVFPNETELCAKLQVGRTTLREAYKALELSGYITRTKRGTSVNSHSQILNATPLMSIVSSAKPAEFSEFRIIQECECAYIAAEKASLQDVEMLSKLNDHLRSAYAEKNCYDLAQYDIQFHISIAKLCRNSLITALINVIYDRLRDSITQNFETALKNNNDLISLTISQHDEIIQAIRSRDKVLAREKMAEHIRTAILQMPS